MNALPVSRSIVAACLCGWTGILWFAPGLARAADPFAEMVRSTPWLSPEEALKAFELPDGFAIQLVAAEPDIGKPISMSFDVEGRLWVAETRSYPGGAAADAAGPRGDIIRVLSDFGVDGRARQNRVFADGLAVPDAVVPMPDGAIVFTIPNVVRLRDADGDGVADRREVLYGPFGARDTHNLANNFRRGFDGWLYGGQGVGNQTTVAGRDGQAVTFRGSTFRFRADGGRIEIVGDGQANVFGLCFDPLGNLFTSDCHSMPIYQVIYGGFYPVFGKPHDGLGYAPQMISHDHGSTAIAGLVQCREPLWPAEFQGNFLLGNVVTSRVNRDRIEAHGSTQIAREMPDLVRSRDPWFRPVDVQFGPDGALYIADFYNRIIAHVEVPLNHPGRDRRSGRIWRVVRLGGDGQPQLRSRPAYRSETVAQQVARLDDRSLAHRLVVLNDLADRGGPAVIEAVRRGLAARGATSARRVACLWILERHGVLPDDELARLARDPDPLVRTHALRVVVERPHWRAPERAIALAGLQDADAFVARAAADGLARHPDPEFVAPLLELRHRIPAADTHLVYQVRKALRDQLRVEGAFARVQAAELSQADLGAVADVAPSVASTGAAAFLAGRLAARQPGQAVSLDWVRHVVRHGGAAERDALVRTFRPDATLDLDTQAAVLAAVLQGTDQRGGGDTAALASWGGELVGRLLAAPAGGGTAPTPALMAARVKQAADWATRFGLGALEERLAALAADAGLDVEARVAAWRAVLVLNPAPRLAGATAFVRDASLPTDRRGDVARAMGRLNTADSRSGLVAILREAPERLGLNVAGALAGTTEGGAALLEAVEAGQVPAAFLGDRGVRDRLLASRPQEASRVTRLTAALPEDGARLQAVAAERRAAFLKNPGQAAAGAAIFRVNCAPCHSVGGQGGNVGPQLDGIGHRGLERLCEDVLNPNRNVDRIFRYTIVTRTDGEVFTGLFRREEGELLVFVDATGREVTVPKREVAERRVSETSLMPANFAEAIPAADFQHLMAYLLSLRAR